MAKLGSQGAAGTMDTGRSESTDEFEPTETKHFGRFLTVLTTIVGGVAAFEMVGYWIYRERWILLGAFTLIAYFAALFGAARPLLARGHATLAVVITCFGMLLMTLSYVVIVPDLYPVLVELPVLVVATGLPFAGVRLLRSLAVAAWLTTMGIATIGLWGEGAQMTSPFSSVLILVGIGCALLLVLMLLVQYRIRARHQLREVAQANAALRYANAELEAFSYSVSHDLRAPLRAIDGYSDALLEDYRERLDEAAVTYLQNLKRGATRMGSLIDDLLSLSQVNRAALNRTAIDISQLAADIVLRSAPPEHVQVEIEPNLVVHGDVALLQVLLTNLIGNALKFSAQVPQPRVRFGWCPEHAGKHLAISDNGAGFDMRYIDKLFKPFQRLHSEREFPGTGIGLATCARVVHKHGGKIWATSVVGHGTTVHFSLPSEEST